MKAIMAGAGVVQLLQRGPAYLRQIISGFERWADEHEYESLAVIGASRDPSSIGRRILDALVAADLSVPVYPVVH